jgi:hypothetical protein
MKLEVYLQKLVCSYLELQPLILNASDHGRVSSTDGGNNAHMWLLTLGAVRSVSNGDR